MSSPISEVPTRRAGAVVAVLVRLALLVAALAGTFSIWAFLRLDQLAYLTNLAGSAFLVVLIWTFVGSWRRRPGPPPSFVLVVVVLEVLVGVVAALFIEPAKEGAILAGLTYGQIMHVVLPVGAVLDFVLLRGHRRLRGRHAVVAALVPWGYAGLVAVGAAWLGTVPYPFIDPGVVGAPRVVLNVALALGVAAVAAALLLLIDRRLGLRPIVGREVGGR